MTYVHYERLSALDATFLAVEDHNAHMHVGAVSLFDAGPLTRADGVVDLDRIRRLVEVGIHRVPRYQQRLATIPLFGYPVWVDDARFNLHYHLRHVSLPKPGDERLLKRLAGRIFSQQLDRGKPLWELWVVDGVQGNRIALITKAHHCMIDGVGSVELTGALMRASAELEASLEHPPRWLPRPTPSPGQLLWGELLRRAGEPLAAAAALRRAVADPLGTWRAVGDAARGVAEAVAAGLQPAAATPLNVDIGPHRRFDWLEMDLDVAKEVKNRLGGTINDVVLSVATGALRRFLRARGLTVADLDFRAMIPVNTRTEAQRERLGNRVAMIVAPLPIDERDPCRRLARIGSVTRALKQSHQAAGVQTLEEVSDWTLTSLFTVFARLSANTRPYNVVITNVPGPQFPTYFLGAPMQAVYPLVPLYRNQGLGVALFSYNGKLFWGFNADWDAVPDLHDLVDAVAAEFTALQRAALESPPLTAAAAVRKRARAGGMQRRAS